MGDFLEQFDKIPASQKVLLLLLVVAAVFVGYYLAYWGPLDEEIKQTNAAVQEAMAERTTLQNTVREAEVIQAEIAELCQRRSSFIEKLPAAAEVESLLQSVHEYAMQAGLDIQSFVRQEDVADVNYTRIPVLMEVKGSYDQVADFFDRVGRMQRIVNINDIKLMMTTEVSPWSNISGRDAVPDFLNGNTELVGPPRLAVSFQISTYFADPSSGGADVCAAPTEEAAAGEAP
jgi:type IV pilus assembly protein PilO